MARDIPLILSKERGMEDRICDFPMGINEKHGLLIQALG